MSIVGVPSPPAPGRLLGINPVNHPGGSETTLLRRLRELAGAGWRVTATTPDGGPLADMVLEAGLEWQPLACGGLGAGQGAAALLGLRRLRQLAEDVDVVLFNGGVTGRLSPALIGRRALRVLAISDMIDRGPRLWPPAHLILAGSEAVARRLRELDPQLDPQVVEDDADRLARLFSAEIARRR